MLTHEAKKDIYKAQLSNHEFKETFARIIGQAPSYKDEGATLKAAWLDTPLGPMLAIADEHTLHLLEFVDSRGLLREVVQLRKKTNSTIILGETAPILSIEKELNLYFKGKLKEFKTPLNFLGSPFQKQAWTALKKIPYGETRSYLEQAKSINAPYAFRAVARANGANQIAIVIPCHRVINANGALGGYAGGLTRKQWLLQHEKNHQIS